MARAPPRSTRDAGGSRNQGKERRAEKRNPKTSTSSCLTKALSSIAKDMPNIGVTDVATFAQRSAEARQMEATKAGKVKRPLNAFMLYRKAYQDIAKTQCSRNNHQQVSTICGSSWNGWEPPEVIDYFKQLASIEKERHEGAFPSYKYDPIQGKKPKDDSDQNLNTCGLSDGESACRPRRSGRQRPTRGPSRMKTPFSLEAPDHYQNLPALHSQPLASTWSQYQTLNLPNVYIHGGPPADAGQYAPRDGGQQMDGSGSNLAYGCMPSDPRFQPYGAFVDPCLDPSLQSDMPGSQYGQVLGGGDMMAGWMDMGGAQNASASFIPDLDIGGAHTAYLQGTEGDWQVEQLEDGSHFSDWMMQSEGGNP